eukprot:164865-Chlamydomonas_euryale.AAC.1
MKRKSTSNSECMHFHVSPFKSRVAQYGRISRFCRTYGTRYGTVRSYGRTCSRPQLHLEPEG